MKESGCLENQTERQALAGMLENGTSHMQARPVGPAG